MKTKIKTKIFSLILAILIISPNYAFADWDSDFEEDSQDYFVVTAYYSPLPWQDYYAMWSYEKEIIMEWEWISWASGYPVFNWMFAWPKSYPFWTQIYLEWVWLWVIADRWWAIVEAWERGNAYDRIDIWMWYWDEWLARAMAWGKRTIPWKIISTDYDNLNKTYKLDLYINDVKPARTIFNTFFSASSSYSDLYFLQSELKSRWLYNWPMDWKFNEELKNFILRFQIYAWIIKNIDEYWAWTWGNSTIYAFKKHENSLVSWEVDLYEIIPNLEDYRSQNIEDEEKENIQISENISSSENSEPTENIQPSKNITSSDNSQKKTDSRDIFATYVHPDSEKEDVEFLQKFLTSIDLYDWEIDWNYEKIYDILLDYQLENWIIKSENEAWAWHFWPSTRKSLKIVYDKILLKEKIKEDAFAYAENLIEEIWDAKYWETWTNVRTLQKTLAKLWYFDTKDTWNFFDVTKNAILEFQIANKLVTCETDAWAWKLWPKTLGIMKNELVVAYLQDKLEEKNK